MKKNIDLYIATNLQYLRKQHNKTQKDIGDLCGKTYTAVSNWEQGIREPDTIDLGIIANYFNLTVDDIMFKDLKVQNAMSNNSLQHTKLEQYQILFDKDNKLTDNQKEFMMNFLKEQHNKIDEESDKK